MLKRRAPFTEDRRIRDLFNFDGFFPCYVRRLPTPDHVFKMIEHYIATHPNTLAEEDRRFDRSTFVNDRSIAIFARLIDEPEDVPMGQSPASANAMAVAIYLQLELFNRDQRSMRLESYDQLAGIVEAHLALLGGKLAMAGED